MNKKIQPIEIGLLSREYVEVKVSNFIIELQKITKGYPNARIEYELDYSNCYSERDIPETKLKIVV